MSEKLIWMKWIDSSEKPGPLGKKDCGEVATLRSAGFLVSITDEAVCLCADIADPEWQDDWHRGVTTVPMCNVVEMRMVDVADMVAHETKAVVAPNQDGPECSHKGKRCDDWPDIYWCGLRQINCATATCESTCSNVTFSDGEQIPAPADPNG